ncbi:hypothetical protein KMW28_20860 [Flammeovirga yaeyamensis]|uniref:Lipoprotein n=1 Tax=Flammeovirga yaeyamensis TaxID=367791 RepID=A0AAX1NEW4_9BACT|nr:hypothetical protein [Flammeovirga yaeyamensis]MBB3697201.1 hypothetical protein [Flammeovirga yaeyamensis]NMF33862.1 hypothetical protein [Flammeovirga yaeyamensis]QWG04878.1 hypothetical protein KMW28_20860 [Flammeovirga yaeyamensis]
MATSCGYFPIYIINSTDTDYKVAINEFFSNKDSVFKIEKVKKVKSDKNIVFYGKTFMDGNIVDSISLEYYDGKEMVFEEMIIIKDYVEKGGLLYLELTKENDTLGLKTYYEPRYTSNDQPL